MKPSHNIIRIVLSLLLIFGSVEAMPQLRNALKKNDKKEEANKPQKTTKRAIRIDTIYSSGTKKQHGWFMPIDTISKECASHRFSSFRFTNPLPGGHWGKLENIDGYGNYVEGQLSPYILKTGSADTDNNANKNWIDKVQSSCIFEFSADPSGRNIVQERAYDKNHQIIYIYSRVPAGNGVYIGSYKDDKGLPAEMRADSAFTYGTLIRLTEDRWGNDSVMEYIDAKGVRKPNSDGVAMEVYVCDKNGHVLKQVSRNEYGEMIRDNWGNCGIEYSWNNGSHTIKSATYKDEKWQSMSMPSGFRSVDGREGVICTKFEQDKYKRLSEEYYVDETGKKATNKYGVHRKTSEYNDKGQITLCKCFDKEGRLIEDYNGTAVQQFEYDSLGRYTLGIFLGRNMKPQSNSKYLSKAIQKYNASGDIILTEQYKVIDGNEVICYKEEKGDNYIYTQWDDGTSRTDSLDNKGRTTKTIYRDSIGNIEDKSFGYAIFECIYNDSPKRCIETDTYYNAAGEICMPNSYYARQIQVVDTIGENHYTSFISEYDEHGLLLQQFIHEYKNDSILRRKDCNRFGVPCRAGNSSGVRCYNADVEYITSRTGFSFFFGRDEFGEADYIASSYPVVYYYKKFDKTGKQVFIDENNKEIDDIDQIRNTCPKLMTIEVIDSMAYSLGLKDNDLILIDGSYSVDILTPVNLTDYASFMNNWSIHSVIDACEPRSMVVFRVNPETLEYGLVKIDGLKGTPSELGYVTHIRYLTQKQFRRIQDCVKENIKSENPIASRDAYRDVNYSGNNAIILGYDELYLMDRHKPYPKIVTDPAILIGTCDNEKNFIWDTEDIISIFKDISSSRKSTTNNFTEQHYYFTRNGANIIDLVSKEQLISVVLSYVGVSDEIKQRISKVCQKVKPMLELEMGATLKYNAKQLMKKWSLISQGSDNDVYAPTSEITFNKDFSVSGYIEQLGEISFSEGNAVFLIRQNIDGKWDLSGRTILYTPSKNDSISIKCIDLKDAKTTQKKELINYLNANIKHTDYFLNKMDASTLVDYFSISELSKDRLVMGRYGKLKLEYCPAKKALGKKKKGTVSETKPAIETEPTTVVPLNNSEKQLLGTWRIKFSESPKVVAQITFNEDRSMTINMYAQLIQPLSETSESIISFDIKVSCTWKMQNDTLVYTPKIETLNTVVDFDATGVDEATKAKMKEEATAYIEEAKQEFAISLISSMSSGKQTITQTADGNILFGDYEMTRAEENDRPLKDWKP